MTARYKNPNIERLFQMVSVLLRHLCRLIFGLCLSHFLWLVDAFIVVQMTFPLRMKCWLFLFFTATNAHQIEGNKTITAKRKIHFQLQSQQKPVDCYNSELKTNNGNNARINCYCHWGSVEKKKDGQKTKSRNQQSWEWFRVPNLVDTMSNDWWIFVHLLNPI